MRISAQPPAGGLIGTSVISVSAWADPSFCFHPSGIRNRTPPARTLPADAPAACTGQQVKLRESDSAASASMTGAVLMPAIIDGLSNDLQMPYSGHDGAALTEVQLPTVAVLA